MRELVARAPVRIDFGGGWTDVPPYTTEHGGSVCSVAIARYATVRLRRCDNGVCIEEDGIGHRAESAAELGAEGSGSLASVALGRAALGPVALELRSGFPRGAGLGGSSALV